MSIVITNKYIQKITRMSLFYDAHTLAMFLPAGESSKNLDINTTKANVVFAATSYEKLMLVVDLYIALVPALARMVIVPCSIMRNIVNIHTPLMLRSPCSPTLRHLKYVPYTLKLSIAEVTRLFISAAHI